MNPLLELSHISKYFPVYGGVLKREVDQVRVINDISLTIRQNEILSLVGESGCGKTTLGKLIMHIFEPTQGSIRFLGETVNLKSFEDRKSFYKNVQMIFQDPFASLNPRMRVGDIIGEMLRVQGVSEKESVPRVKKMLEDVELSADTYNRYPHEFSGGQRQRIAIARALIVEPKLIIADEPVSALDLPIQSKILELLKRLKKKYEFSILFISHDLNTVSSFSDRTAVMYLGKIVESLPSRDLINRVAHPYVTGLIQSLPVTHPNKRKDRPLALSGEVPSPLHLPSGCYFHPRCPLKIKICEEKFPPLTSREEAAHQVACWCVD